MITPVQITALIRRVLPDARVQVTDRTGTLDHYNVSVASKAFDGMSRIDQHRLVYQALGEALKDGQLHAVELKTEPI
jgi:stress-induced morphogen